MPKDCKHVHGAEVSNRTTTVEDYKRITFDFQRASRDTVGLDGMTAGQACHYSTTITDDIPEPLRGLACMWLGTDAEGLDPATGRCEYQCDEPIAWMFGSPWVGRPRFYCSQHATAVMDGRGQGAPKTMGPQERIRALGMIRGGVPYEEIGRRLHRAASTIQRLAIAHGVHRYGCSKSA